MGRSDGLGAIIDNVRVRKGSRNLVRNGGFEKGHNVGLTRNYFSNLLGWRGRNMEIGNGRIYSRYWNNGDHVCELDSRGNNRISQIINLRTSSQPLRETKLKVRSNLPTKTTKRVRISYTYTPN